MPRETCYFARRPFLYGDIQLQRGQVTELLGLRNDEKLVRLGFLAKVETPRLIEQCGKCGARFAETQFLEAHGKAQHSRKPRPEFDAVRQANAGMGDVLAGSGDIAGEMLVDVTGDAEERRLEQEAPIYWEKTAASQKG